MTSRGPFQPTPFRDSGMFCPWQASPASLCQLLELDVAVEGKPLQEQAEEVAPRVSPGEDVPQGIGAIDLTAPGFVM